jgi:thiol:disulfide interchange protein DsbA
LKRPVSASAERRVERARVLVIALSAVLVTVIGGIGLFYVLLKGGPDEVAEGTHYRTIEPTPKVDPNAPIRVTEFFSYACPHCMTFEPMLHDWVESLPDDVRFDRTPVSYTPEWTLLANTYYVLLRAKALDANHDRLFAAIHNNGKTFGSKEAIADFVDGHGINRAAFLAAFDSSEARRAMTDAIRRSRDYTITSVPTLVIGDRYVILPDVSRRDTLTVADALIAKLRTERTATGTKAS